LLNISKKILSKPQPFQLIKFCVRD